MDSHAADRLGADAEDALHGARRVALRFGHAAVTPAHAVVAALEPPDAALSAALASCRAGLDEVRGALERALHELPDDAGPVTEATIVPDEALGAALRAAGASAAGRGERVGTRDLLRAIFAAEPVVAALRRRGIDAAAIVRALEVTEASVAGDDDPLTRYATDLTARARAGKLDPVVGREPELRQVIEILSRRLKNNPLLVGEPGVGKTAIVEGLAQRIAAGHVPEALTGHMVLSLDLGALLAGTRYRGQFEERLKELLGEIARRGHVLLFIDEIHTLIGAGGSEGGTDAANLLKPALSRGELRCIGATTVAEHRKRIEKDAALSRRFQLVAIDEPSGEQALTILRGLKPLFEEHHGVRIADGALGAAVHLATRHLTERLLPDKAIDLVDQAAAGLRTTLASRPAALEALHDEVARLELEAQALEHDDGPRATAARTRAAELRERLHGEGEDWLRARDALVARERARTSLEEARQRMKEAVRERRYAEVAELQYQSLPTLEAALAALVPPEGAPGVNPVVTADDVATVVARMTGIPAARLGADEGRRLLELDAILGARVVGQVAAVAGVSRAIRRARAGLRDPRRPLASFLLVGPTGVGKTELCKALAEFLFADERAMVRLDMSEYMEKHAVARLVGAPPGYIGFDEGGELTNRIRRKPYSVVLLDEVEKAHPDLFNLLLQVLDEGHLTDSSGRRVDFKNTVIMMTSNLGAGGRGDGLQRREAILAAVKRHFRPELLNRLDDLLVFEPLDRAGIEPIVRLQLAAVERLLAERQLGFAVSDAAVTKLAVDGFDPEYGARSLKRFLQETVQDPMADLVLRGEARVGDVIALEVEAGALVLRARAAA
jgi:ATP-dependent Clp protease ATP-binding subunit ClpB